MTKILPVILSGGSGTRLWPLSRGLYPKQFMDLDGSTLFENTVRRVINLPGSQAPLVICNREHRFLAANLLQKMQLMNAGNKAEIILEPCGRNTAPAVAIAAFAAVGSGEDALLLVLPSDHSIAPQKAFEQAVQRAVETAEKGFLLTFGVVPTAPETGYGYIVQGAELDPGVFSIRSFVEKPAQDKARALLADKNCFWNSGMFMFKASAILQELKAFVPQIYAAAEEAWNKQQRDLDFIRIDAGAFEQNPSLSLDYAVMEHTANACVVPLAADWHDLGTWEAFYAASPHDADGNGTVGDVMLLDSENCYLHSTSRLLAGIGLKDLMAVETPDAVLILPRGRGQEVKVLLDELKAKQRAEIETHLKVYRPWGSYETLVLGEHFQVKIMIVKPGASLSMQMHYHRAEHWVVARGTAKVLVEDREQLLAENTSTYIPLGARHQLINPGHIDLEIIEIQSGSYLGEDDIVRYQDAYGRN
ncbi:MAG: mannose-1-phosphate guanylyltransferase/mannose-6-phosphate isomerase [Deltaproteobacteria bacterium]|jgi:mannose-1-phosphate guanylyltransferase/mannose-6-phosphate isomerase|nr:mannose-1-phosphate guanylyltransferase/mannose-6-phosphate isomerase [Deltaproteobacteria bacterium]